MQITETRNEGLQREFKVVVPATDLGSRVDERLNELKGQVQIKGFRPGKVPAAHVKKMYGRSVMAETIEAAVRDANAKIVEENGFKLASEPKVTLPEEQDAIEAVISGNADLAYTVALEVMPAITLGDFKSIKLERETVEITDAELDEELQKLVDQNRPFEPKAEGAKAAQDDKVTISFLGKINGEAFAGGQADDVPVIIGSNAFIPGFEEKLIGFAAGESGTIQVPFPAGYANAELAGKDAEFDITVKSIEQPGEAKADDEFAKSLGLESLEKLKEALRDRIKQQHAGASRQKMKRHLLDQLDEMHKFDPPPSLVEDEFNSVWNQVNDDLKSQARTFEDEGTTEDKAREDYRRIAERRVRLGLVLAEIGEKNQITVGEEEVNKALVEQMRRFPGQEQQVYEYYRKTPQALASLRAPIYEEKVVDFIVELGDVTDKTVSKEELYKDDAAATA